MYILFGNIRKSFPANNLIFNVDQVHNNKLYWIYNFLKLFFPIKRQPLRICEILTLYCFTFLRTYLYISKEKRLRVYIAFSVYGVSKRWVIKSRILPSSHRKAFIIHISTGKGVFHETICVNELHIVLFIVISLLLL